MIYTTISAPTNYLLFLTFVKRKIKQYKTYMKKENETDELKSMQLGRGESLKYEENRISYYHLEVWQLGDLKVNYFIFYII